MGLPSVPVTRFKNYTRQVRGLLEGRDVLFKEGSRERWIRLVHGDRDSFINLNDPIPIYLAATGRKALQAVGELADGWVTNGAGRNLDTDLAIISEAARQAGRSKAKPYTIGLTPGLVLREGELIASPRVMAQVGPNVVMRVHGIWEATDGPGSGMGGPPNPEIGDSYNTYIQGFAKTRGTSPDRLYLDVHRGHMTFLKPGEERFVTQEALSGTLTGIGPEIIQRLEAIEAAGVDNIVVSVTDAVAARDFIKDFGREVIAKRA